MKEVLKYLVDTFSEYKEKIEALSTNNEQVSILEKDLEDKINLLLDEKVFESKDAFYLMHMLELYYVLDVSRFTMDSYSDYMAGKYKKAIVKYKKLGDKTTKYEKALVEYISSKEVNKPVQEELNTLIEAKKLKNVKTELLPMYLSWILLTPIWAAVYYLIFYIALYFFSKGAIYVGGAEPFVLFLPAFITAIINSFFTRKIMYKLFFRKDYNKIIALDEIENSEKVTNVMSKLFQFVIAVGIVFSILAANTNISFYDNNFKNNLDFLNIEGETIDYADVYCVYKADGIRNDFGQVVNNSTYVIVLNGGRQIDLYYYMEFEDITKNIVPILEKHNIEIREIDLVDSIENYNE